MIEEIPLFGNRTQCQRCGESCQVAAQRNPDAGMLRLAKVPEGLCINCAVRGWFYIMRDSIPELRPESLRLRHVQAQFYAVMKTALADAKPEEINWQSVIACWDLPIKPKRARPKASRG